MDGLFITSNEGSDWKARLDKFLQDHETKRIHISIKTFEDTCSKCGKTIAKGNEREYCGRTYCGACAQFEEEVDEECT